MLAVPPIIAEIAPGIVAMALAVSVWFKARAAHRQMHSHKRDC